MMTWDTLWMVLGGLLALVTLPGTVELALLSCAALLPRPKMYSVGEGPTRIVVVVPAHNESGGIGATVASLLACDWGSQEPCVLVIADNCSDDTARCALEAGARVIERKDPERRGKGYALQLAFDTVLAEGADAVLVVDADTVVDPSFIVECRRSFAAGADAVQSRNRLRLPASPSVKARIMGIAYLAMNTLRPMGRERLGLSVGLFGNGLGYTRETLLSVPHHALSVIEDLEYHLRLVDAGRRVRYVESADSWAPAPSSRTGFNTQRARWEGGRFGMLRSRGLWLAGHVFRGRLRLLEPLLDLLLLPLAFHITLLFLTLVPSWTVSRLYALVGLGIAGGYTVLAVVLGGGRIRDLLCLVHVPFYIVWKIVLLPSMLRTSRKDAAWVRTDRDHS